MSRKPNIKWRSSDSEKLEREVKRFNAKISRLKKAHPEMEDILPERMKKKDLKQNITTREEFNKTLKSLDRFTKKGAEKVITSKTGNKVTAWEKKEITLKVQQINRDRAKERAIVEKLEATSQGKPLNYTRGEMHTERLDALQPKKFDFDKIRGGKEWEKFKETVNKQASSKFKNERKEEYKQNYIKGLQTLYNADTHDGLDALIAKLEKIPADEFVEIFYRDQEATIDFIYEPHDAEMKLDILNEIWDVYGEDNEE